MKKRVPIQSSFRRESSIAPAPKAARGTSRVSVIQNKKVAAKKQVTSPKKVVGQGIHGKAKQAK